MTTPKTSCRRHREHPRPGGFTLVELLVVITIIVLLMGILVPTVQSVLETAQRTEAQARIESLAKSVELWAESHDDIYPGQIGWDHDDEDEETWKNGSRLLAEALFTSQDGNDVFPASTEYADYTGGILFDYTMVNDEGDTVTRENVISDGYPTAMPILYYPARAGSFRGEDNEALINDETKEEDADLGDIADGDNFNVGFLLLCAGADRLFFSTDDLTNIHRGGD